MPLIFQSARVSPIPFVLTPPFPGYVLKFNDDFNAPFTGNPNGNGPNGWRTTYAWGSRSNGGTGELQEYCDSTIGINPFTQSGSVLTITASLASVTGANPDGKTYNSGILVSDQSFWMQYGYMECRFKLAAGQGFWFAFWMLANINGAVTQIYNAELDGFEAVSNDTGNLYSTLHSGAGGATSDGPWPIPVTDWSANFHTLGVDWDATNIKIYVDGALKHTFSTPATLQQQMYMLFDFAVGGSFPGNPDGTTVFPGSCQIDFIRAWANPSTVGVGGSLAIP